LGEVKACILKEMVPCAVFWLGFKNEGTFVLPPLKMRDRFQNLMDIKLYVV